MEQQQDLLQHVEQEVYLERVTAGIRFANYIIDVIAFYALVFATAFTLGAVGALTKTINYDGTETLHGEGLYYSIVFGLYFGYYIICEAAFKGRTLGKLITGCKVVTFDGSSISWGTAVLRTLARIVPFEPFSAFSGNPWHDQWTNTQVVKARNI